MNNLIKRIIWILFAIALLVFSFQIMEPSPFDILVGIAIIIFFLLICIYKKIRDLLKKSINIADIFLILFLLFNIITLIISKSILEARSLNFFFKTLYLVILYFITKFLIVLDIKNSEKIMKYLLIGILIMVGFVWLNYILFTFGLIEIKDLIYLELKWYPKIYFNIPYETGYLVWGTSYWPGVISGWGRAIGWFKDPNVFGSVLAILILCLLFFWIHQKDLKLWKAFFILPYLGGMIIFINSKGVMISLIITLVIFLSILKIKFSKKIFTQTLIALFFLIILPLTFLLNGWYKPWTLGENQTLIQKPTPIILPHQSERGEIVQRSIKIILQSRINKLIFGYGASNSAQLLNIKPYKIFLSPHNTYLLIFLENGLVGLFLFLSFLFSIFCFLWKKFIKTFYKLEERLFSLVLLAGIFSILNHSLVIDSLHWRHFWLILGIASGLITDTNLKQLNLKK